MTLAFSTDTTEQRECTICRSTQTARLVVYVHGEHWSYDAHNAPCGLPCIGGGVRGPVYKTGQVHGHGTPWVCPRCGLLDGSNPGEQCQFVERHGTEGLLCCGLRAGHLDAGASHTNAYGNSSGPWMTRAEWERDYGEAARNCYSVRR